MKVGEQHESPTPLAPPPCKGGSGREKKPDRVIPPLQVLAGHEPGLFTSNFLGWDQALFSEEVPRIRVRVRPSLFSRGAPAQALHL
jgi:hypothetical protein